MTRRPALLYRARERCGYRVLRLRYQSESLLRSSRPWSTPWSRADDRSDESAVAEPDGTVTPHQSRSPLRTHALVAAALVPITRPANHPSNGDLGRVSLTIMIVGAELFAALLAWALAVSVEQARRSAPARGCAIGGAVRTREERRRLARIIGALRPAPVARLRPAVLSAVVGTIVADPGGDDDLGSVWAPIRGRGRAYIADDAGDVVRVDLGDQVTGQFHVGDAVFVAGAIVADPRTKAAGHQPLFREHHSSVEVPVLGPGPGDELVVFCGTQAEAVEAISPGRLPDLIAVLGALPWVLIVAAIVTAVLGFLGAAV